MTDQNNVEQLAVNTIRTLAMDAVQKANSGHPGMPMGTADFAFVLWNKFLRFNPIDPDWTDRDRFLLSGGHGSMLQYALLHLAGFDISINDIKNFRQWDSCTAGHPEKGLVPGVETTTGPLGQGIANAVGMAIAGKMSAERFNTDAQKIVTGKIFVVCGDGDLMEGISTEAASMAAHLKLDNLVMIFDDNKITIDGGTDLSCSEDIKKKYEAMGWCVLVTDGHDRAQIEEVLKDAVSGKGKPVMVMAKTHIAFGSPGKQDTSDAHGAPLGDDEVAATKKNLGWNYEPFHVPEEVYELFKKRNDELASEYETWQATLKDWEAANPEKAALRKKMLDRELPADLEQQLLTALPEKDTATRGLSGLVLQKAAELVPGLAGGSADLAPSNKTFIKGADVIGPGAFSGRNFHFGIREHAMGAVMNGMTLYGGFIPYGGTFLVFADYMRTPIRLASLMDQQAIYVFTHDSFYVGEDGPTHQPIEHLATLRAIPGLVVIRPADGIETAAAWALALKRKDGPTVLSFTRQGVPTLQRPDSFDISDVAKGAYIVSEAISGTPDMVIVAAGSEVAISVAAKEILGADNTRVVSMPSMEIFDDQSEDYKNSIIPPECDRVVTVEAGSPQCWYKYAGRKGLAIGLERFGASAPGKVLAEQFGFTPEKVAEKIKAHFSL